MTNEELLRKATLALADFGGGGEAPLSVEQVAQFLRMAIKPQVMLPDVRTVMSNAAKWQESTIDFSSRIMRRGLEGERLDTADRVKPTTGIIEINTVLLRGEVPVTDEVMEDQVERAGFADTIITMVAEGVGRDVEELLINGDKTSAAGIFYAGDVDYLEACDGWLHHCYTDTGNNKHDVTTLGQDYQAIFGTLLKSLPAQYKRDLANMRFYVPTILEEKYRDTLAERGTALGDEILAGTRPLTYQGVAIKSVPMMSVIAGGTDISFVLLTHRMNLYAGFRRVIKMEQFRDPREGVTSFIVTCRVDAEVAVVPATALAYNVNVEP